MKKKFDVLTHGCVRIKKVWLIMRFLSFFLIVGLSSLSAAGFSQKSTVKLNLKDATITQLFNEIEAQTEYNFFYQLGDWAEVKKVNISANNNPVIQITII